MNENALPARAPAPRRDLRRTARMRVARALYPLKLKECSLVVEIHRAEGVRNVLLSLEDREEAAGFLHMCIFIIKITSCILLIHHQNNPKAAQPVRSRRGSPGAVLLVQHARQRANSVIEH